MECYGVNNINELLQDAALKGDVVMLRDLLGGDPLLLHKTSNIYPLHTASKLGHLQLAHELLRANPGLAEELYPTDRSSPLHLASGNGHTELVKTLVSIKPCMCLAFDVHGRNPAHVAAMKGHVRTLEELLRSVPAAARERVGLAGESTIMHLCVKFNRLEALWTVANTVGDAGMLFNATDGDGNTVLHLSVADKRLEIVHFLVNNNRVRKNMQNRNGLTAMDMFVQDNQGHNKNPVLRFTLEQANALQSKDIKEENTKNNRSTSWVKYHGSALMVVASLIATMAFQAGLSPPGRSSQDDGHYFEFYDRFVVANTIGFVSSMSSIILLISGLPGRRFLVVLVMVMMWVAVTSMAYSYAISVDQIRGRSNKIAGYDRAQLYSLYVWAFVMLLLFIGHLVTCPRRLNSRLTCLSG